MQWGEAQSAFQIMIALNIAYFSFREIRTPALARYANAIAAAEKAIDEGMAVFGVVKGPPKLQPFDEASSLFIKRDVFEANMMLHAHNLQQRKKPPYDDNLYKFDKVFRFSALSMAVIGFALLIASSIYAKLGIEVAWFVIFTCILLLPIFGSVTYNWFMASQVEKEIGRVTAIQAGADQLKSEFSSEYLPRYEVLLKQQSVARGETRT
jgi:hypothetical protein